MEYVRGGGRYSVKQIIGPNLILDVTDDIRSWDIETHDARIHEVLYAIFMEVLQS